MKYLRYYPWGVQLVMFLLLAFTMFFFAIWGTGYFLPLFTGVNSDLFETLDAHSPYYLIKTFLVLQGFQSLFLFLVPAFLFAYLAHPKPLQFIGLQAPGKTIQVMIVVFVMLGAIPVLDMLSNLVSMLPFSKAIRDEQASSNKIFDAFLTMPTIGSMFLTLFVLAVIPAFGEELFFRGVLLKFAKKRSPNMVFPIIFTAFVFSASHGNLFGLPSIFLAGVLLGCIYYYTGSLWCSIIAHAVFNGTQILLSYGADHNNALKTITNSDSFNWASVIGGLILFTLSFLLLIKYKTPLPADWTDDFKGEKTMDFDMDVMK